MPAALPADWAGLRILAAQGTTLEELSESTGIALGTICARSAREGWKRKHQEDTEEVQSKRATVAIRAGQMQESARSGLNTLETLSKGQQRVTKLGLGLYAARASRAASRLPKAHLLASAPEVKAVADIMGKVWPEQGTPTIRLSMFAQQPIEVEAEFVQDQPAE